LKNTLNLRGSQEEKGVKFALAINAGMKICISNNTLAGIPPKTEIQQVLFLQDNLPLLGPPDLSLLLDKWFVYRILALPNFRQEQLDAPGPIRGSRRTGMTFRPRNDRFSHNCQG
jgi:hypothetical protein